MCTKILAQINEFKRNRDKYTTEEKRILIFSFREELLKKELNEQKQNGNIGEDELILI